MSRDGGHQSKTHKLHTSFVRSYCNVPTRMLKWIGRKLRQRGNVIEDAQTNGTFMYIVETTLLCSESHALAFL